MTKLTPANIASASAIANGSIIKKVDSNNFAPVVQADITALGFTPGSGSLPIVAGTTNTVVSLTGTTEQVLTSTPTLVKDVEMLAAGTYTVSFNLRVQSSGGFANGAVYVNGVQQGATRSTSSTSYTTYSENITVLANDNIQLYIYRGSGTPIVENDTMDIKFSYNYASLCNVINP